MGGGAAGTGKRTARGVDDTICWIDSFCVGSKRFASSHLTLPIVSEIKEVGLVEGLDRLPRNTEYCSWDVLHLRVQTL